VEEVPLVIAQQEVQVEVIQFLVPLLLPVVAAEAQIILEIHQALALQVTQIIMMMMEWLVVLAVVER
jgi:hypothetical protein